jgi:DnaJ-class molecular chaperone
MTCPSCHGSGKLTGRIGLHEHIYPQLPCEECQGSGVDGYDAEADCIGSYNDAVRAIGARIKAGAPVPPFFQRDKPE